MSSLLKKYRNITDMDVGYRKKAGKFKDEVCLSIWVKEKLPESEVESAQLLPLHVEGVPVDVLEEGYLVCNVVYTYIK